MYTGFGVTPSLLSTYGSLLSISYIETVFTAYQAKANAEHANQKQLYKDFESYWVQGFGVNGNLWSEYTIYRLVLDHYNIFTHLHVPEFDQLHLHCHDVWFVAYLPWNRTRAKESDSCLFSVVQSTVGADVEALLS